MKPATREQRCEAIEHCLREYARFVRHYPFQTFAYRSALSNAEEVIELADWFAETGQYSATTRSEGETIYPGTSNTTKESSDEGNA